MEPKDSASSSVRAEHRWPASLAVAVLIVIPFLMPEPLTLGPRWLLPASEAVLLVAIVVADPGRIDRRSGAMRRVSIALVVLLILGAIWATASLVAELIDGGGVTNSAGNCSRPAPWYGSASTWPLRSSIGNSMPAVRPADTFSPRRTPTWPSPST